MKKVNSGTIKLKDIKHIENSRMRTKNDVADLMADIEQRGLLQPIGIRLSDNALIFGNRRVKAFEKLDFNEIPCEFFDEVSDDDLLVTNLIENIKRKNISSIEIGRICKMLSEKGYMYTEIATKLGITKIRVQSCVGAYNITVGTPFEKLVIEGKGGSRPKGIAEGLIWKTQTSLVRAFGGKITKSQWDILLRAMETGKLTIKSLSLLRGILMSSEDKDLNKALDILGKSKSIYPTLAVNEQEWYKALRIEKMDNDLNFIKLLIRKYNPKLLF